MLKTLRLCSSFTDYLKVLITVRPASLHLTPLSASWFCVQQAFSQSVRLLHFDTTVTSCADTDSKTMSKRKDPTQGNPNKEFCDFLMGKFQMQLTSFLL